MRIGLLSDVHGNLAGLRAVVDALEREGPLDWVVVAGDHLQGGPRPREVWDTLAASPWVLIQGNEDIALAEPRLASTGTGYHEQSLRQLAWSRAAIGPTILQDLAGLPPQCRLATPAGDLLVVHSSPRSISDRRGGVHNTAAEVAAAYDGTGAAAIAFGHWHRAFVRPMPFALLINVASVGLPLDGRPLAAYTIVTAAADGWVVEQRRAPYDPAEEAAAAAAAGMPPWAP